MGKYDDIIDLPHHVSKVHPQMSIWDRSAQFAPFAALTGHEEAIAETARLTNEQAYPLAKRPPPRQGSGLRKFYRSITGCAPGRRRGWKLS